MREFFQYHFKGEHFHRFSKEHVLTLLIIGFIGILIIILQSNLRTIRKEAVITCLLSIILIGSELSVQLWYGYFDVWTVKRSLPLELSDITVLLSAIMLVTKSSHLFKFVYFAGLSSTTQAMLTPDLGIYSFPHFRYIEFFVAHGSVFIAVLFMVFVKKYRPTLKSLWMTLLLLNIYAVVVFLINHLVRANYLYIMRKPDIPTLLNFLGPWPWYLLSLEGVAILVFLILYLPFKQKN